MALLSAACDHCLYTIAEEQATRSAAISSTNAQMMLTDLLFMGLVQQDLENAPERIALASAGEKAGLNGPSSTRSGLFLFPGNSRHVFFTGNYAVRMCHLFAFHKPSPLTAQNRLNPRMVATPPYINALSEFMSAK